MLGVGEYALRNAYIYMCPKSTDRFDSFVHTYDERPYAG